MKLLLLILLTITFQSGHIPIFSIEEKLTFNLKSSLYEIIYDLKQTSTLIFIGADKGFFIYEKASKSLKSTQVTDQVYAL